jgi:hypothetical protein
MWEPEYLESVYSGTSDVFVRVWIRTGVLRGISRETQDGTCGPHSDFKGG